jgi:cysteine desulfuration protein SufE
MTPLHEIEETFALLEEWEDRYAYVIELGKALAPYAEAHRDEAHKVKGCASQVWLNMAFEQEKLTLQGDSDAYIVKGLVAIVVAFYRGRTRAEILSGDAFALFEKLGFTEHISAQRANGLRAMVGRIREFADS